MLKKIVFTFFRNITETKEVSFGQPFKLDNFLSVFSEESYIFEVIMNAKNSAEPPSEFGFVAAITSVSKQKKIS